MQAHSLRCREGSHTEGTLSLSAQILETKSSFKECPCRTDKRCSRKKRWWPQKSLETKSGQVTQGTSQSANERPFTEIHHTNKSLVLCFLDEEKWSYLDPQQPGSKLPSTKYTTKYYCVKGSCIKTRFPYYNSLLLQIPPEASSRL